MRGLVNGLVIMAVFYALVTCAVVLPHHPCEAVGALPWLHCLK